MHCRYFVKQTVAENKEIHQLTDIVLMYHQILRTKIKCNVWQSLKENFEPRSGDCKLYGFVLPQGF